VLDTWLSLSSSEDVRCNAATRGCPTLASGCCCAASACAPLTAAGCRLVSHTLTNSSRSGASIPVLTMALEPKATSPPLRSTLAATFAEAGPDPRLVLSLTVVNTGSAPLRLQTALPYLRGVRLGTGDKASADLGLQHQETGIPGVAAWGGCGAGGATSDSCGGMLGYHQSSQWQQVYAADGSQGLGKNTQPTTTGFLRGFFGSFPRVCSLWVSE
jgi:hypothetical protein